MQASMNVELHFTDELSRRAMLLDTKLSEDGNPKFDAGSDLLLDQSFSTADQLLLQDYPDTSSELGRAWPSSISAESDYSLFSENKLLLDQD